MVRHTVEDTVYLALCMNDIDHPYHGRSRHRRRDTPKHIMWYGTVRVIRETRTNYQSRSVVQRERKGRTCLETESASETPIPSSKLH